MDGTSKQDWKKLFSALLAIAGGLILSFSGFGILWIGSPWHYQLLMFFPFLLLSFVVTLMRTNALLFVTLGAVPLGSLIPQARDPSGSHLMPILTICAWVAGIFVGYYLGNKFLQRSKRSSEDAKS